MSSAAMEPALAPADLNRLRWRCRRGLLENDLLIERFFVRHGSCITLRQAEGLGTLMELPDNDLLDLLLGRTEPGGALDRPAVHEVLAQLRPAARHGVVEYAQATRNPR